MCAWWLLLKHRYLLTGLALGLAVGCRVTSVLFVVPLVVYLFVNGSPRNAAKQLFLVGIPELIMTALLFLPALTVYGTGFFYTYPLPYPPLPKVFYKGTIGVMGVWGCVALAGALLTILFRGKKLQPAETDDSHRGVLLFAILFFFSHRLLHVIIESENIYVAANEYLTYRQFGIMFVVFNFLFRSFYVGISTTQVITFSTIIMAVVNIFFDWALIFGHVGLPAMGIGGAALASLLAEITAFCFFWIYTYIKLPHEEYGMFRWHQWQPALMGDILKVAFPSMIQRLFSFGAWFIFFVMIEKMGEMAIGVSSVVRSTYMILIIPGIAFASTANTLTSRIIGEGKSDEVMAMLWKVVKNTLICSAVLVAVTMVFPTMVLHIYTDDVALAQAAVPSVYVVSVATLVLAAAMVFFEAVSGTGNTAAAMALEFGVLIIYIIYVFLMSKTSTIAGVWTAEWLYNLLMGVISFFYIWKADWRKKRI